MLDVQKSSLPPFGGEGSHMMKDVDRSTLFSHLKCSPEYLLPAKADSLPSTETLKPGEAVPIETLKPVSSDGAIMQNLEAAKVAAAFIMNIPETIVQLVIDAHRLGLDPTLAFSNAEQLASAAQDVASSPQRQGDLAMKIHQAQEMQKAQEVHQKHRHQGREGGVKAAAWMGGAGVGVSVMGDCQKPLAGMSEACQSATACSTATTATATSPAVSDQKNDEKTSAQSNGQDVCGSRQSGCEEPAAEMLHGLENDKASDNTSPSPHTHTRSDLSPKEQLRLRLRVLAAENRKLKNRKVCRACLKVDLAESGITFLPCGHFITCEACSEMFDDCPACGKNIMGTVRTFLS